MRLLDHPLADIFLLGAVSASFFWAGLFFLRFWRSTRDFLFLAFAGFFFVQGATHVFIVSLSHPNEGDPWLFLLRLISILVVLAAILRKNFGTS